MMHFPVILFQKTHLLKELNIFFFFFRVARKPPSVCPCKVLYYTKCTVCTLVYYQKEYTFNLCVKSIHRFALSAKVHMTRQFTVGHLNNQVNNGSL